MPIFAWFYDANIFGTRQAKDERKKNWSSKHIFIHTKCSNKTRK